MRNNNILIFMTAFLFVACGQHDHLAGTLHSPGLNRTPQDLIIHDPSVFLESLDNVVIPDYCKSELTANFNEITVPMDWEKPDDDKLIIKFLHSNPTGKIGLFFLAGGPGETLAGTFEYLKELGIINLLPQSIDIIFMEHRGTGCSQNTTAGKPLALNTLTIDQAANDVRAYLKTLKKDRIIMGGASYGAFLALAVTVKYPELIDGVMLDSVFGSWRGVIESSRQADRYFSTLFQPHTVDELAEFYHVEPNTFFSHLADWAMGEDYPPNNMLQELLPMTETSFAKVRDNIGENAFSESEPYFSKRLYYGLGCHEIWSPAAVSVSEHDLYYDFAAICPSLYKTQKVTSQPFDLLAGIRPRVPTLVISGDVDFSTPQSSAVEVFKSLPNSWFIKISATNHAVTAREPKMITKLWTLFAEKLGTISKQEILQLKEVLTTGKELTVETNIINELPSVSR